MRDAARFLDEPLHKFRFDYTTKMAIKVIQRAEYIRLARRTSTPASSAYTPCDSCNAASADNKKNLFHSAYFQSSSAKPGRQARGVRQIIQPRQRNNQLRRVVRVNRENRIVVVFRNSFRRKKVSNVECKTFFDRVVKARIARRLPVTFKAFEIIARVKIINPTVKGKCSVTPRTVSALMFHAKSG